VDIRGSHGACRSRAHRRSSVYRACRRWELQTEAEDYAKFATGIASAYLLRAMKTNPLPAGSVVPAQPVKTPKPAVGTDWVHEIKHDGYRIIVRRDGCTDRKPKTAVDRLRIGG
jgi:ATP-dependent DNA ligase